MGKVIKAVYGGIAAAVTTFTTQSATGANIPLWGQVLIAIGAGIAGFQTVYWAPANKPPVE